MTIPSQKPSRMVCIIGALMLISLSCGDSAGSSSTMAESPGADEVLNGVPALVDLGSTTCVPCQMMEEELERVDEITGERLAVSFIDVNEDPDAASEYNIRVIPTQIFKAPDGTELYRHEGYMSAEQILAQWIALGYDLNEAAEVR